MTARRALLIACSRYDDPKISELRAPSLDVAGVGEVLADPAIGGFALTPLIDATEGEMRRKLGRFLRDAGRTDLLLIYFAGHGFKEDDGQLHLGARDTELADVEATGLPAYLLCRMIDRSPSRRTVLVLDCCYSGAVSRAMNPRDADVVQVGEAFRGQGDGRVIITASRATEYAYEPGARASTLRENPTYSVFAEAFIDGLRTGAADLDGDGAVSVQELYEYVHQRVVASAAAQTPGMWNQVHGKLVIAHRAPSSRPRPTPAKPEMLRSPYDADLLDWRFGATEGLRALFAEISPDSRAAWRTAGQGDWAGARAQFPRNDPAGLWGRALCDAVDGEWLLAGTGFRQAAEDLSTIPPLYCGASLLSAVTLRRADSPLWYEPLEQVPDRVPCCPQVLAYRGVQLADERALSLALQLAPDLIDDFAEVGTDLSGVAATALIDAEGRAALLLRAVAAVNAIMRDRHSPVVPVPDLGSTGRPAARLRTLSEMVSAIRRQLGAAGAGLHALAEAMLEETGDLTRVGVVRETSVNVVTALRETDRPVSVPAAGMPPRHPPVG